MPLLRAHVAAYIAVMIRLFRPLVAIALAFLLVFTAQSMAVARGVAGPAGSVVLCTGTGPVTILTDANGQPVGHAHICPDCTLLLILAVAQGASVVSAPVGLGLAPLPQHDLFAPARHVLPFSARDPPVAV